MEQKIENLESKIKEMIEEYSEIERIMVISKDGLMIASSPSFENDEEFAAKAVLFSEPLNEMLSNLGFGKGNLFIARTDDRYFLLYEAENAYIIMVVKKDAPMGFLLYDIEEIARMV